MNSSDLFMEDFCLRKIRESELDTVLSFQKAILDGIPNNETENLCEALTEKELRHSVHADVLLGIFHGAELIALMLCIPHPLPGQNIFLDLSVPLPGGADNVLIVDSILVSPSFRGLGLQCFLFSTAELLAKKLGIPVLGGVANPKNSHSNANFLKSGYELIATKPKYRSVRNYYLKRL